MSDSQPPAPRKQTPRVPRNTLYSRIVPIAIGALIVLLLAVIVIVLAPLLGIGGGY